MNEEKIADKVAERLEGRKEFEVLSRETVYYARKVWARDEIEAESICHEEGDYGEAVDYGNWQFDAVREIE